MNEFERIVRNAERKAWLKNKVNNFWDWCSNNQESIMFFTPVVIGAFTTVTTVVGKNLKRRREEKEKNLFYDRSLGRYWTLKRKLNNSELLEIDKRKSNGERLANILENLKVLK